jgi:hypothetical protein
MQQKGFSLRLPRRGNCHDSRGRRDIGNPVASLKAFSYSWYTDDSASLSTTLSVAFIVFFQVDSGCANIGFTKNKICEAKNPTISTPDSESDKCIRGIGETPRAEFRYRERRLKERRQASNAPAANVATDGSGTPCVIEMLSMKRSVSGFESEMSVNRTRVVLEIGLKANWSVAYAIDVGGLNWNVLKGCVAVESKRSTRTFSNSEGKPLSRPRSNCSVYI